MALASAPDQAEYGGYDFTFTKPVPEKFYCSICTKVFHDPHLTGCCGQHYCESCLKYWFRKQKKTTCPHCRHDNFNHMLNKALKREVDELEILCIKQGVGCQWVGELSSLQAHLNSDEGCKYVDVQCSNKCGAMMMRKELEAHLAQQCPLRKIQCQYCHYEDTYQIMATKHYDECRSYLLPCPNNCGTTGILRTDMANHRSRCELEPVKCPYYEAGCCARILRREFDAHMSENQQNHILVLLRAFEETKRQLGERQRELSECQRELGERQRKLDDMTERLLDTRLELEGNKGKTAERKTLKKHGDEVTFHMTNFSLYKLTGRVWHSPPFYFDDGYKLCVAVYAIGKGAGAGTHVSVELLQMRGEHDKKLTWWEEGRYIHRVQQISIQMIKQHKKAQSQEKTNSLESHLCTRCFSRLPPNVDFRACQSRGTPIQEDKLIDVQSAEQLMLLNDTIVLKLKKL